MPFKSHAGFAGVAAHADHANGPELSLANDS